MILKDQELIKIIKEKSLPFYSNLDFAHNETHCARVEKIALVVCKNIEGADPFLVQAGAWLHQYHDNLSDLKSLLDSVKISQKRHDLLFEIVKSCRPLLIDEKCSLEAKIVFDADSLDLIGSYGMVRELLCNAIERKMTWEENVKSVQSVQELFIQKLQTESGKEIAKKTISITREFWNDYSQWELLINAQQ